ncbi:MAG TPA: DUF1501 domain-containing protein [Blastocatellia bacterium]|nr:DUF1501 domain-containing protein [Blastocatellia bacterium]
MQEQYQKLSRRELIFRAGAGFSGLALASLLDKDGLLAATPGQQKRANPLAPKPAHFQTKAKSVIFLFMYGGVSHVDTFDPKPDLTKHHGKPMNKGKVDVFFGNPGNLMASPYKFQKYGESGIEVSELYPYLANYVDDLCLVRSVYSTSNNHSPAIFQMNSGNMRPGNPSLGSWITYGLGSENENLPSYIVMYDWRGGPIGGAPNWSSGFMPAAYQGTAFRAGRSGGTPIADLNPPKWVDPHLQRAEIDFVQKMNQEHLAAHAGNSDLDARIASYELAFQMQTHAPEAMDLSKESDATKKLYGVGEQPTDYFGKQCLVARRMVERGVRFIQLYSGGGHQQESWDAHYGLHENHSLHCAETDKPMAGLIRDLKARGLLDSTLIVWGGEFGRMPISQSGIGRDHNPHGFTMWMAGGGVKGGQTIGATDEYGYKAAIEPYSVHDMHATILHAMGLDHRKLTYYYGGREQRLTNFGGDPVLKVFA